MVKIFPIILAGGSGTRLWPISRKSYPKQFAKLMGTYTLFQETVKRFASRTISLDFQCPTVITNSDFRFMVSEQLSEIGFDANAIIIEPDGRNTAPAILAAAEYISNIDPSSLMLVAPSDHFIADTDKFEIAIAEAVAVADSGRMVTFGIKPTRPETGYGYLKPRYTEEINACAYENEVFIEKPDVSDAEKMYKSGEYLWNSGIFLFKAADIISASQQHASELSNKVKEAVTSATLDLNFIRLAPGPWMEIEGTSIDYAIMEKVDNLAVIPYLGDWSDLGSWSTVFEVDASQVDNNNNVTAIDCRNSFFKSNDPEVEVVGLGLENVVVVATKDAVLVSDLSKTQSVKEAVSLLKQKNVKQADSFPIDYRPWGHFETLAIDDRFQVKRIIVKPGAALSLQSHVHRSEHWIVVKGTAKITVGEDIKLVTENESVYIPLGVKHRLENPGKVEMTLIEVQTGIYLGEDDIVRYHDNYARGQGEKG